MRRLAAIPFLALCAMGVFASLPALAQQPEGQRKILNKVIPHYPELARQTKLKGTVKLAVTVAPNGCVKFVQALGGNPVLLKAAQDAIYKWKWVTVAQESKELVELRIDPN